MKTPLSSIPTKARWKSSSKDGYILISQMDDFYLLNAIRYCINKKGHKHTKLDRLVVEAQKRGLPLPRHKWIKPVEKITKDNVRYADDMAKTVMGIPEIEDQGECPICRGTVVSLGHGRKECLNCGRKTKEPDDGNQQR